ncbi:zf-HC2 domain-containing protein [Aquincola tertiaricarbonis]|uniref:zf-HC2 domain-containing protein n=1 Tax=Aquincola tertiaricarbonis TaxID=391953 RepID=UPI002873BBFD|nr:zf-HC2 domain-containing protein [Aquincola tertiaricarbonis]
MNPAEDIHRRTWEQMTWVVSGSADAATRDEVARHLAGCERCREEYDFQCRLRDALQADPAAAATPATAGHPADPALKALWAQVDAQDAAQAQPVPAPAAWAPMPAADPRPAANAPAWQRWLVAAVVVQAVALVVMSGTALRPETAPGYGTLSSAPAGTPPAQLRVAPAPGTSLGDWQALLRSERLRVVDTSADGRFYGLASEGGMPPDAAQLARLRADPRLQLVEPVPR